MDPSVSAPWTAPLWSMFLRTSWNGPRRWGWNHIGSGSFPTLSRWKRCRLRGAECRERPWRWSTEAANHSSYLCKSPLQLSDTGVGKGWNQPKKGHLRLGFCLYNAMRITKSLPGSLFWQWPQRPRHRRVRSQPRSRDCHWEKRPIPRYPWFFRASEDETKADINGIK